MRVLAVDLGLTGSGGLAVLEEGDPPAILYTEALPPRQSDSDFLRAVTAAIDAQSPDYLTCERPWTSRNDPRRNVALAQSQRLGLLRLAWEFQKKPKTRFKPIWAATAKNMLCGKATASKWETQDKLKSIFGQTFTNEHVADAVNLAFCRLQQLRAEAREKAWGRSKEKVCVDKRGKAR